MIEWGQSDPLSSLRVASDEDQIPDTEFLP